MESQALKLPSFAKINLFLRVLGKRGDGFHEIVTVFQTISLCDYLTFSQSDSLEFSSNDSEIPTGEANLIVNAARRLQEHTNSNFGAAIFLEKNIPFPGGLGGGSSNAAIALLGLATLWNLRISFEELLQIASEIGSDVPFFFYGGTATGKGRGTEISVADDQPEKPLLIVTPNIEISTAEAYAKLGSKDLTKIDPKSILKNCRDAGESLESGHLSFINDFEKSVFKIEPELKRIKEKLLDSGADVALLSGSGASVFAIFDNEEKQQFALKAFESEKEMRKFAVRTISRREYIDFLKPCKHLLPKSF